MNAEDVENSGTGLEVAIIGMAGRFPGARDIEEFWENLKNGIESVSFFSHQELEDDGVPVWELNDPKYIKARGMLADIDHFDALFFGYPPEEARRMDPQLRLFHECTWQALEDAAYDPGIFPGLIGLYAGATNSAYWQRWATMTDILMELETLPTGQLSDKDHLCSRVSYKLDLKGPVFALSTQCSTSLVAIHLACQGLLSGECDMALAGGVAATIPQKSGYIYQQGMLLSRSGHCKSFDANADGTIFGNGIAVVLLKRLVDAIDDSDHIYTVIKASAVNNDGSDRVSYPAPGVEGQAAVIRTALQVSQLEPETIGYIETHGTASLMGDPIEIEALKLAFDTDKKGFCRIGTVKSNLGHLDAAAGVTGLIKTVLILKHGLIPPSLHFENSNPNIDFESSPFRVVTELTRWERGEYPRRAGVSAFGIGGTNAHVILEEAPAFRGQKTEDRGQSQGRDGVSPPSPSREYQLILLSAKTETARDRMTKNLVDFFKKKFLNHGNHENPVNPGQNPGINLADVAYTLQKGRRFFRHRCLAICKDAHDIINTLSNPNSKKVTTYSLDAEKRTLPLVFMFSGLGSEYVNMGRDLYEHEPIFREEMDRCFQILEPLIDFDIKEILYPGNSPQSTQRTQSENFFNKTSAPSAVEINQAAVAPIVMFVFQYALARLLLHWGIKPDALIGYSFGEYAAACISGVFSLEEGLKIVAARAELVEKTPEGAMLNVPLPKEELVPLLPPQLSLAIDNDISCLVAGPKKDVDAFAQKMKEKKHVCMRLQTSRAVHSPTMTPILKEFEKIVTTIKLNSPGIPYISNVTGKWISSDEAADPRYWPIHLRHTVCFADGIKELLKQKKKCIFMEIGPGRDLSTLILRYIEDNPDQRVMDLVRLPQKEVSDVYFLLNRVGRLWLYGKQPDWNRFYANAAPRRVSLPPYPFDVDSQSYRLKDNNALKTELQGLILLFSSTKSDVGNWFYQVSWKRLVQREQSTLSRGQWLVLMAGESCAAGFNRRLLKRLKEVRENDNRVQDKHPHVIIVEPGSEFARENEGFCRLNPANPDDYDKLMLELRSSNILPRRVLHLWNVGTLPGVPANRVDREIELALELGFYSLLYLTQAIGRQNLRGECEITVVTDNMHDVVGEPRLCPGKMTSLAAVKVIPQEYPGIICRSIDIVVPPIGTPEETVLVEQLAAEINSGISDTVVAFRGNHRWVRSFESPGLPGNNVSSPRLRQGGVYLITGGLGGIGMILARGLFTAVGAKLILTTRQQLPRRSQWNHWLEAHPGNHTVSRRIRWLRQMEDQGAEVLVLTADAADEQQMQAAIARAEERFGQIHGVIHSAGIVGGPTMQMIQNINQTLCQQQFKPKVYGLLVLEKVLKHRNLDFCLLMSSISSVLGGLGYAAYAAANLFMDAFVYYHNRHHPQPWISVNWDEWQLEPKEQLHGKTGTQQPARKGGADPNAMTPEEGFEAFKRIISQEQHSQLSQVAISTWVLKARINQWIKLQSLKKEEEAQRESTMATPAQARPDLMSSYMSPQTPVEKIMAEIIGKMLGFDKIGIEDDFFELGIDSIKMIQIRARLNKRGYSVEMADFFQYPTIAQLAPLVKELEKTEEEGEKKKLELPGAVIEELKKQYPIENIYPLTPMQEGMLFYSLYEREDTSTFFEQLLYRLQGNIQVSLLEQGVNELIKRHDVLRSVFIHKDLERPLQAVLKERQARFYYEDLRSTIGEMENDRDKERFIEEFRKKDRQQPFDLSKDVLIRIVLLQWGDNEYYLLWSFHHILMDGWCIGLLHWEFFVIYYSLLNNRTYQLPLVQPYYTYIRWLESRQKNETRRYWRNYLQGYQRSASIPKKRDHEKGYRDAAIPTILGEKETGRLKQLAARNHVTLNTVFQAIWAIVLGRYTGQQDVVFGVVVSGRPSEIPGVESMIGCFVNTVPIRIIYDENTPFNHLLKSIQQRATESEPHHYCSLAEIQAGTTLKQELLDHVIDFQNFPIPQQIEGAVERIEADQVHQAKSTVENEKNDEKESIQLSNIQVFEQSNYDLNIVIFPRGPLLDLNLVYNANTYETKLMMQVGLHSFRVLQQVLENEEITIKEIDILSEEEKDRLLENLKDEIEPLEVKAADINADFDF